MNFQFPAKQDFTGGMNRLNDPTSLGDNQYSLLVNGRVRFGGVLPVKLPEEIETVVGPTDILQGVYTADTYQLIFVSGRAYIRNFALDSSNYNQIIGFQLDPLVQTIYTCLVPASSVNFKRELNAEENKNGLVNLTEPATASPSCVICQDGINQPFIIFADGTTRLAKTYGQWNATDREYVPVGKQMLYSDAILYVVIKSSVSNRFNLLARSVSGRPLDFGVNVDINGDIGGTAETVAYAVSFSEITCLASLSMVDRKGFFVSTLNTSFVVLPDYTNTLFAEPTFSNTVLFNTGALNQFSLTDLLGDTALIDSAGIRSFNAVEQLRTRGQNSPFSTNIQPLLEGLLQTATAAFTFDNYAFFGVNTIHGNGILVYDTLLQQWVSLDLYPSVTGNIVQFSSIDTVNLKALFFRTDDNKMYQAFASATYAECGLYGGEYKPVEGGKEQKPEELNLVFVNVEQSGTINATCYLDSQVDISLEEPIEQTTLPTLSLGSVTLPFGTSSADLVRNVSFDFSTVSLGWKTGYYIQWNFGAKLVSIKYKADIQSNSNSLKQQSRDYARLSS